MVSIIIKSILFVCCIFSNGIFADPITNTGPIADVYQIEVIVFAHTDPNRFANENWPKFVGNLDTKQKVNLDDLSGDIPESLDTMDILDALDEVGEQPLDKVVKSSVNVVEPKHLLLKDEVRLIKTSKNERFIKHIAWNQPLATNVKSTPVYFSAGNGREIEAVFAIKPARNILSINIDLIYKLQADDKKYDPGIGEIRITRDVKIKRKEVYYLDHPVIGLIITAVPLVLE